MSINERTALLHGLSLSTNAPNGHIVYMPKDIKDYEPIFDIIDYSSGLTLDELLPYKDDPWWQNARRLMFYSFWLTLLLTFLIACLLSYLHDGGSCKVLTVATGVTAVDSSTIAMELLGKSIMAP